MSNIIIKPLDNNYSKDIIDLVLPIQQREFNVPVTLEGQPDLFDIETNYFKTGGCFWGAFNDEQLVGTIALIVAGQNGGIIRKMFVTKEFRGKEHGVAQLLLEQLIKYSKEENIADLYLGTVEVFKAARRFYEKNGFTVIAKASLPPWFLFMPADTLFYHLHLA